MSVMMMKTRKPNRGSKPKNNIEYASILKVNFHMPWVCAILRLNKWNP